MFPRLREIRDARTVAVMFIQELRRDVDKWQVLISRSLSKSISDPSTQKNFIYLITNHIYYKI